MLNLLVLDNVDSFTFVLVDYLRQAGARCRVIRNTVSLDEATAEAYDAIVLSPGPGTPAQAGTMGDLIAREHQRVPILGVCLGHQALGTFFGARLERADRPMHGKQSLIRQLATDPITEGLPETFTVTRYHSLVLRDLPASLVPLLATDDPLAENMGFRHRELPIWGLQFHPEAALTEYGLEILRNWITFAKRAR